MFYVTELNKQEDNSYIATFPDMPNVLVYADCLNEAIYKAKDALENQLVWDLEAGNALKEPECQIIDENHIRIDVDPCIATACRLFEARRGKKASAIAELMNVEPIAYLRLEKPNSNPTLKTLAKVAKALGKNLDIRFI